MREYFPKLPDLDPRRTPILVILRVDEGCREVTAAGNIAYAGLVLSDISTAGSNGLVRVVRHELGGHAIGQLEDEYTSGGGGTITYGGINVSHVNTRSECPWSYIFTEPAFNYPKQYSVVSLYEGAGYTSHGKWRPEPYSCMVDNCPYFNAPSRVAIVKRIKEMAGEPFSYADFVAKDLDKNNPLANDPNGVSTVW